MKEIAVARGNKPPINEECSFGSFTKETYRTNTYSCLSGHILLSREIKEIPTLMGLILKYGLMAVIGQSDAGKSAFLRHLAICVASGNDFLNWKNNADHNKVIYVSTEDDEIALSFLLKKQNDRLQLEREIYSGIRFITDFGDSLIETLIQELEKDRVDLIVIDAFTDVYGGRLNEANQVRMFLNDYQKLVNRYQCLIVFLHHTVKDSINKTPHKVNAIGSQAFEAKMRCVMELREDYFDAGKRHLCIVKGNYIRKEFKTESFVLNFEDFTFSDTSERVPFEDLVSDKDDTEAIKNKVIELYNRGVPQRQIAHQVGRSLSTVNGYIHGVRPERTPSK